jgi:uncharacterized membrane protein YeaQ/YmgE (transglycosylase-associated protein family)
MEGLLVALLIMVVVGGLVGLIARALMPGPNPMSMGMTILLGIGGSFIGGLIGRLLNVSSVGGLVLAVFGSMLLLWVVPRLRRPG